VPVPGAQVVVSRSGSGAAIASTSTDAAGNYQVSLAAGTYVVTIGPVQGYLSSKDVPATVTVAGGQTTTLNILLDTGIR
jgi:hypothetical protein